MSTECKICFEEKKLYALPCSKKHTICDDCYRRLKEDTCPYCRAPFINIYKHDENVWNKFDPEPWLDLGPEYIVYSSTDRRGTQRIHTYKRSDQNASWRDTTTFVEIKRRRKKKHRKRRSTY